MRLNSRKVAIVGTGIVGSSIAFSLINQGICDDIYMIDVNAEKARGEALDLIHGMEYLNKYTKVECKTYADCKDADIIVITAGPQPSKGQTRLDIVKQSAKIIKLIVEPIMASGFDGYFIVVSNPVDSMAYYVKKISQFPKNKVLGSGTSLDSARLKNCIGDLLGVDPRSVQAYSMGEHGDSQMVPWSHVSVGGKAFSKVIEDNLDRFGDIDLDELTSKTVRAGWEVFNRKGCTGYGIAVSVVAIIKAILYNENRVIPISAYLDGEYGQKDIYVGVPAVINSEGIKEIVEIDMNDDELKKFENSCNLVRRCIDEIE